MANKRNGRRWANWGMAMLAAAGLAACDSATESAGTTTTSTPKVTYWKDVAPILNNTCVGCHSEGGIGPFPLGSYAQAKASGVPALAAIESGRMPPWGALPTETCAPILPFAHDSRLSDAEKATFRSWVEADMPEGNPADLPEARKSDSGMVLTDIDQTALPKAPYTVSGSKDVLRCFVLDAEFAEDKFLNATQVVPGNPLVVHHVLLFLDPKAESTKLADANGQYDCFGAAGVPASLIAAWAPGGVPSAYPPNAGTRIPKGSKLVMQVHYHPNGETAAPDLTKVQLRFTKGEPELTAVVSLIGNSNDAGDGLLAGADDPTTGPKFLIPAGKSEHTEEMVFTVPQELGNTPMPDLRVYAVGTHMHYVGTDMQVTLERATAIAPCAPAEIDTLASCLQTACPTATNTDLYKCAEASCSQYVGSIGNTCSSCLQTQLFADKTVTELAAACKTEVPRELKGPKDECLIQTPKWDFNWQRIYQYDAPYEQLPVVRGGDVLRLTCRYNNSKNNPFVVQALHDMGLADPVDVKLGEATLDEMCLLAVQVLYKP